MAKVVFLILFMMRSFGVAKAASEEPLNRDEEIHADQWKWEMTRNGWNEKETTTKRTRETCEERKKRPGKQELVRNAIRKEARKPTEALRYVVLNVSAWKRKRSTWKDTKAPTTCSLGSSTG